MDPEVQEDHLVTISCSVESWPLSQLTLEAEASSAFLPLTRNGSNVLNYTLKATPAHRGTYTCRASNGKGPIQIKQRELVVKCTLFTAAFSLSDSHIFIFGFAQRSSSDLKAEEENCFR